MRFRLLIKRLAVRLALLASLLFALGSFPHLIVSALVDHAGAGQTEQDDDDDLDEEATTDHAPREAAPKGARPRPARGAPKPRPSFVRVSIAPRSATRSRAPPRAMYKLLSRMRC